MMDAIVYMITFHMITRKYAFKHAIWYKKLSKYGKVIEIVMRRLVQ